MYTLTHSFFEYINNNVHHAKFHCTKMLFYSCCKISSLSLKPKPVRIPIGPLVPPRTVSSDVIGLVCHRSTQSIVRPFRGSHLHEPIGYLQCQSSKCSPSIGWTLKTGGVPVEVYWISETISEVQSSGIPIDEMYQPL